MKFYEIRLNRFDVELEWICWLAKKAEKFDSVPFSILISIHDSLRMFWRKEAMNLNERNQMLNWELNSNVTNLLLPCFIHSSILIQPIAEIWFIAVNESKLKQMEWISRLIEWNEAAASKLNSNPALIPFHSLINSQFHFHSSNQSN